MKYVHVCYEHNYRLHDLLISDALFRDEGSKPDEFIPPGAVNVVVREVQLHADYVLPDEFRA